MRVEAVDVEFNEQVTNFLFVGLVVGVVGNELARLMVSIQDRASFRPVKWVECVRSGEEVLNVIRCNSHHSYTPLGILRLSVNRITIVDRLFRVVKIKVGRRTTLKSKEKLGKNHHLRGAHPREDAGATLQRFFDRSCFI